MASAPLLRRASLAPGLLLVLVALVALLFGAGIAAPSAFALALGGAVAAPRAAPSTAGVAAAASAAAAAAAGGCLGLRLLSPALGQAALLAGAAATAASLAAVGMPHRASVRARAAPPCEGEEATDPTLWVQTNVDMGEGKKAFMKAASKAVAACLGKPESYVAICVQDKQDIIWGGSDDPCALCKVVSLGGINLKNNKALTQEVSKLLADFTVPQNRIYVNFYDLEGQNIGYNGATFAG
eukprot:CAMPEP_0203928504 /NCGR_PEP_ID=MMETSP0359-20131031/67758_1 /ASSEMBLY_ACC=CAM_ASM_000338 /TAXON_ID=268821 /ORGANISM="Scrippsiella Hangoei, Strain SHTV-5" /LENGTH=239 /DNA_ID=CAMNT_0050857445 /DNA_START=53 /DNA_END=772 /DNA_ORIENTATION=+